MNAKQLLMTATLVAAMVQFSTAGFAQNLLDQELGGSAAPPAAAPGNPAPGATNSGSAAAPSGTTADKPPAPADPKAAADPAAADPDDANPSAGNGGAAAPGGADIISPEAVQKVDDDELVQKLTNSGQPKPTTQPTAAQVQSMLDRMGESAKLLTVDKNPGDETQETQRRIILDLDTLIAMAEKQQQQGGGQSQGPPKPGQQRQPTQAQGGGMGQGGSQAATNEHPEGNGSADVAAGELRNHDPATWGKLPLKDREAISHGASEEYLPSYRDLIDRYYQALAELAKSDGK